MKNNIGCNSPAASMPQRSRGVIVRRMVGGAILLSGGLIFAADLSAHIGSAAGASRAAPSSVASTTLTR